MIIDCISDLHGELPDAQKYLPGGDILIIGGDLTASDKANQYDRFFNWLWPLKYERKILIAGNHDHKLESVIGSFDSLPFGFHFLNDSGCDYKGFKIWGSPYTPKYGNWGYMCSRGEEMRKHWDLIPSDIDILITHGPPHGILDQTVRRYECRGANVGCEELYKVLYTGKVKPKLHAFGHIHEGYGQTIVQDFNGCLMVNCSHMNENYEAVNPPIRIIL